MKKLFSILLLFCLCSVALGQVFPDSLKRTWIAKLKSKDTLTIYIKRKSCFLNGIEKFQLTRDNDKYMLTAFIVEDELLHSRTQFNTVLPDTLGIKKLNTYMLTDTNVIAFANIEMLGKKCSMKKPHMGGGAVGVYKMILKNKKKEFLNICKPIKELEDLAIPEKYYDDVDEQERLN